MGAVVRRRVRVDGVRVAGVSHGQGAWAAGEPCGLLCIGISVRPGKWTCRLTAGSRVSLIDDLVDGKKSLSVVSLST
jgi:hypothetical protein